MRQDDAATAASRPPSTRLPTGMNGSPSTVKCSEAGAGLGACIRTGLLRVLTRTATQPVRGKVQADSQRRVRLPYQGTVVTDGKSALRRTGEQARRSRRTVIVSPLMRSGRGFQEPVLDGAGCGGGLAGQLSAEGASRAWARARSASSQWPSPSDSPVRPGPPSCAQPPAWKSALKH